MTFSASGYALLAAQSYFYYRDQSINFNDGTTVSAPPAGQQSFGPGDFGFTGWSVDFEHSYTNATTGFSATVFVKDGQYAIVFRGTDDWRTGQGDAEQNTSFLPYPVDGTLGSQTREAIAFVENFLATSGADLNQLSFSGHSLGGGLAGIAAAYFDRPAVLFDPAPYANELKDVAIKIANVIHYRNNGLSYEGMQKDELLFNRYVSEYNDGQSPVLDYSDYTNKFFSNINEYVKIYRVQGEVLDLLPFGHEDYGVSENNYHQIDLGDSYNQNSWYNETFWSAIGQLFLTDGDTGIGPEPSDARNLHHISMIVLAVLGMEGKPGVVEVYNALRDRLRMLMDGQFFGA